MGAEVFSGCVSAAGRVTGHSGTSATGHSGAAETGVSAAAGPATVSGTPGAWNDALPSDGLRCKYRGTPSTSFSMGRWDSGISSVDGAASADGHSVGLCQSG